VGPLPVVTFDQENGAWYVLFVGLLYATMTYFEASRSIWRGCVAGAIGGAILCGIWMLVRTRRGWE